MKKLISLLMVLLLVLTSAFAFAESAEAPATDAPAATEAPAEADASTEAETAQEDSLIVQGLLVTVIGLAGVFLVLILFFLTIKMMHKMLK